MSAPHDDVTWQESSVTFLFGSGLLLRGTRGLNADRERGNERLSWVVLVEEGPGVGSRELDQQTHGSNKWTRLQGFRSFLVPKPPECKALCTGQRQDVHYCNTNSFGHVRCTGRSAEVHEGEHQYFKAEKFGRRDWAQEKKESHCCLLFCDVIEIIIELIYSFLVLALRFFVLFVVVFHRWRQLSCTVTTLIIITYYWYF